MKALNNRIFDICTDGGELGAMLHRLLAAQKNDWPELKKNYAQLESRQTRTLGDAGAGRIVLQCNPARIGSTLARTDSRSLKERKCFLCLENLPPEQQGILYRDDYLVLCNPYPIFAKHFTIACLEHKPQAIAGSFDAFLSMTADAGPEFTIFYNGPRCGASAPDHLHFQACPSGQLPIEKDLPEDGPPLLKSGGWEVRVAERTGRGIIVIKARDIAPASAALIKTISALQAGSPEEPFLNMIARKETGGYRVLVFPRRKFRPDCFYREGDARIAVSPAAVELGGLIITPLQQDFDSLDFAGAVSILKEVSLDAASITRAFQGVK